MSEVNDDRDRGLVDRLRSPTDSGATEPMGYEDRGGIPRGVRGDEDGPWIKEPAFTEKPIQLWTARALTQNTAYEFSDPIDVEQARLITLYLEYATVNNAGQLSLIPQALREAVDEKGTAEQWMALAVINPTIASPITPAGFDPVFGSRTFMASELRTLALAADLELFVPLTFDVTGFRRFRLGATDLDGASTSTLSVFYSRSS